MSILGKVLGGVATTLFGNALSTASQKSAEKRQFEYQKQLNAEMNAYNTPAAQMQRYVEAGINPYMASVSSGTQGSAGSVSTSSGYTENFGDNMSRSFAIANAEKDLQSKELAIQKQGVENQFLPDQIQATIDEVKNRSKVAKYQAALLEHDYGIIKDSKYTTSKETGLWPRLDRLSDKVVDKVEKVYNKQKEKQDRFLNGVQNNPYYKDLWR